MARDPIARRRSARASADDEADVTEERSSRSSRRGRGGRSEAPAEEETTRRRPRSERAAEAAPPPRREARKGWGAAKEAQAKAGSGKYSDEGEFKAEEENTRYLLKPLEDEPFETAFEHFIWELDGRKSWSCEETKECPLCAVSDTPKPFSYLNVVDLNVFGKDDELIPETKYWRLSPDPAARLGERAEELAEKDRGLGDSDVYIRCQEDLGQEEGLHLHR